VAAPDGDTNPHRAAFIRVAAPDAEAERKYPEMSF
jgi:hypothetical protein